MGEGAGGQEIRNEKKYEKVPGRKQREKLKTRQSNWGGKGGHRGPEESVREQKQKTGRERYMRVR